MPHDYLLPISVFWHQMCNIEQIILKKYCYIAWQFCNLQFGDRLKQKKHVYVRIVKLFFFAIFPRIVSLLLKKSEKAQKKWRAVTKNE